MGVPAAARDGAQLALAVERLKDKTRVVGQPAHHPEVNLHEPRQAHGRQSVEQPAPVGQPPHQLFPAHWGQRGGELFKALDLEKGQHLSL